MACTGCFTRQVRLLIVPDKNQDQLDLPALHRVRARLVSRWTAIINQIGLVAHIGERVSPRES